MAAAPMVSSATGHMPDDHYNSSSWDYVESAPSISPTASNASHSQHSRPLIASTPSGRDPSSSNGSSTFGTSPPSAPSKSVSPPPQPSIDTSVKQSAPPLKWRDSVSTLERRDTSSSYTGEQVQVVEPTFDENVLRALCDMDSGVPLLLDRIKQSMVSCREASVFFKKRAVLEEEYGRGLQKLAKSTSEVYSMNDGKAGTFVVAWQSSMKIHETMAENRIRFSQRLNEMSEDLATLAKEVDKNRKQTKELATRYERSLQESETAMEKSKARFDMTAEELERVLVAKEGESMKDTAMRSPGAGGGGKRALGKAVQKGGMLLKGKNPQNIQRQEDDIRARMSTASDVYRKAVLDTQSMRQEYFNFQLPRILRALKECADEIDLGTQYHLTRYAYLFETIVLSDGTTLAPPTADDGQGLKSIIESIDNRADFKVYMQNYAYAHGGQAHRGPKRDGPWEEGFVPPLPSYANTDKVYSNPTANISTTSGTTANSNGHHQGPDKARPTFGVDLSEQMTRDTVEIPPIIEKCCSAIEKYGLTSQGLYRISGTITKVLKLKERLDKDVDSVNLDTEEWSSDINNVTSVLKLWLRELPDPLLTHALHQGFIEAAKIENDRLRHIRLHERVNELPDPNYATLKFFMGHLHKVVQHEAQNAMSISNIAIVFGPTLFGLPNGNPGTQPMTQNGMADAAYQNKAIETILEHYTDIFIDENEEV
ncbi:RhoGAP-domain-containing protein [Fomitiporia mediterranea MF3/22]|uniref:RhoGAP-domain-containing protein n=1 Tax=Fomitiporia mediterranea (strain MF3/22) TaxID=694068 RepID=UPI000440941F|nr:RhoGAP-domain-containing protein [Fomitiporia mediterranea MF3/22]EJD07593.1 RhoGAP-domain-containing protein [Fomitiporia mediterranea MF3/22]